MGWVDKHGKTFIFAYLIQDNGGEKGPAGLRAKEQAKKKLEQFLDAYPNNVSDSMGLHP